MKTKRTVWMLKDKENFISGLNLEDELLKEPLEVFSANRIKCSLFSDTRETLRKFKRKYSYRFTKYKIVKVEI